MGDIQNILNKAGVKNPTKFGVTVTKQDKYTLSSLWSANKRTFLKLHPAPESTRPPGLFCALPKDPGKKTGTLAIDERRRAAVK